MKLLFVLLAAFFLSLVYCPAQESEPITTDRPTTGTGPDLVPVHSLELENGLGWSNDGHQKTFDLPESLLRLGLTDRIETRTTIPNAHFSAGQNTEVEDIQFGAKIRLRPSQSVWPMSFVTALSAPTGTSGLTSGGWDPSRSHTLFPENTSLSAA
jgi:hypothetical protein